MDENIGFENGCGKPHPYWIASQARNDNWVLFSYYIVEDNDATNNKRNNIKKYKNRRKT